MEQFVGLDVSQKLPPVCVVDREGKTMWRGHPSRYRRISPPLSGLMLRARFCIGFETGALSTRLWHGLKKIELPIGCLDARHAKAAFNMQVNKSDRNDAFGLTQIDQVSDCRRPSRRTM